MNPNDRILFLKYALPCATTLVKRGTASQENVSDMIVQVSKGIAPQDGSERIFVVANAMCNLIRREKGKNEIDAEVIREYFLLRHSQVVDERFELMKDFNPVDCKTYAGTVIEVENDFAIVETKIGRKKCKITFVRDVAKWDLVVIHYDYIIERIDEKMAKAMQMVASSNAKRN